MFVLLRAAGIASATGTQWRSQLLNGSNHNKYCTYQEYDNILETMMKAYPKLLRKEKVGESVQKRPLRVYHLTDQDSTLPKDLVFINSLIHAKEAQTVLTLMDYVARTLEAIEKGDPQALYTMKRRHVVFMPFINIDSYIANEKSRTRLPLDFMDYIANHRKGIPMPFIRKNQRAVCLNEEGKNGVDLNRNFPVGWEEASPNKCDDDYRGEKPFSEPETQAIESVVKSRKFKVSYNIHSFGHMLIRPGEPFASVSNNHLKVFDEIQQVVKAKKYGTANQTVHYLTPGNLNDWLYEDHGIFSMTCELGTAFWQEDHERAGLLAKEWPRTRYVVYKTGCEPRVDLWNRSAEFSVSNDGVSDCPSLKLAYSRRGGDAVVVSVGNISARESKKMSGNTSGVKNVCVKEEGLDVCICNPTSPGKGTWENRTNALCAVLVKADSSSTMTSFKASFACNSEDVGLGEANNLVDCAQKCLAKVGCELITHGEEGKRCKCYQEKTKNGNCDQGSEGDQRDACSIKQETTTTAAPTTAAPDASGAPEPTGAPSKTTTTAASITAAPDASGAPEPTSAPSGTLSTTTAGFQL